MFAYIYTIVQLIHRQRRFLPALCLSCCPLPGWCTFNLLVKSAAIIFEWINTCIFHLRPLHQRCVRHEEAVMADLQWPRRVAHTGSGRPARPWPQWIHLLLHAQVSWQDNQMCVFKQLLTDTVICRCNICTRNRTSGSWPAPRVFLCQVRERHWGCICFPFCCVPDILWLLERLKPY